MKKSLLALAVFGAFAVSAQAQNVTVYGIVDAAIAHEGDTGAVGNKIKLSSGGQAGSRIGFKGTEDLGGGLKALFTLESGFDVDDGDLTQAGKIFGRQAFIGLQSELGTLTAGKQWGLVYSAMRDVADPFVLGTTGRSQNVFLNGFGAAGGSYDNSLKFASTNFGGVNAEVMYGLGENAGDASLGRSTGLSVGYGQGPIAARVVFENKEVSANNTAKTTLLAGTYNFGVAKAHVGFGFDKNDAGRDARDTLVGVSAPMGNTTLMASYIRHNDRTVANADADQFAIGASHALTKRTNVYASYAKVSNDNGAAFKAEGAGNNGLMVGVRHNF